MSSDGFEYIHSLNLQNLNGGHLGIASIINSSGTVSIYSPSPQCFYGLTFPGFTGNADQHRSFIQENFKQGIGTIAVTPTWSNSVDLMRKQSTNLLDAFSAQQPNTLLRIRSIRAVSFGAYLCLPWANRLRDQLACVALIAPCSGRLLEFAGRKMNIAVKNDSDFPNLTSVLSKTRIYSLQNDEVVPEIDFHFFRTFPNYELLEIANGDHFTFGDDPKCSEEVSHWFAREFVL